MPSPIIITHDGKRYTWDGSRWYGTDDYTQPPQGIVQRLNALIAHQVAAEDAAVSDPAELLSRAKRAQASGQLQRAAKLARQVCVADPGNIGAAAVLSSILREMGRPEEALEIADRFRSSGYPPILTSRGAALCDLGRWEEALHQIRQVLAIGMRTQGRGSGEALAVHGRIKANAPELFE
jgi:predicted Zn-dependent protease